MDLGLRGKKAIVTGATRGIGRAIVDLLAAEGCDVGLCARSDDEVQEALSSLRARGVNWWKNFEVDVLHTVRGCETLMEHLKKSGQGSVVVISSTNAIETFAAPMAYNAMKAALITYSKQLSQFVGKSNVRVNSICPGPIYFEGGAWEMIKGTNQKFYDATLRAIPCGRMGTPEELARLVAFIASPAASLVTGANIVADNGFTKGVRF
jgi:3-oxoacyl-[acyl-carrier protein] reductase